MRNRPTLARAFPAVLAAVLYVALGISASWHAPHFSQGVAAVHTDRHTGGHEIPAAVDCALCVWKSAAQELEASGRPAVSPAAFAALPPRASEAPLSGSFGAALPRGPPAFS